MKNNEKIYTFFVLCFFSGLLFWLTQSCEKKNMPNTPQGNWQQQLSFDHSPSFPTVIKLVFSTNSAAEIRLIKNFGDSLRIPVRIEYLYDRLFAIHLDAYKEQQLLYFLFPDITTLNKKETKMYFSYTPKKHLELSWKLPLQKETANHEVMLLLPE